jgi:hypothetical protein
VTTSPARSDVHRPAEFDPADYRVVDYLDNKRPDFYPGMPMEMFESATARWRERIEQHFPGFRTDGAYGLSQCNHCGHNPIRWVAVVEHVPTGAKLAFGEICAERCDLSGRDSFRSKFIKDRAAREKAASEKASARASFEAGAADVVAFLASVNDDYDSREPEFLLSVKAQLGAKGTLSDAQVEAIRKFAVKRVEFEARRAAEREARAGAPPLPEGRRDIRGRVVSTKWSEDRGYGSTLKMLVEEDDGNRVYGSVPEALWTLHPSPDVHGTTPPQAGDVVSFAAAVERSRDDEHFGFFKRPTKASYVSRAS